MSIFDPASPPAESILQLAILVLAITGFIFLIVEGVLGYCIVRFGRGAGDEKGVGGEKGVRPHLPERPEGCFAQMVSALFS